MLELCLSSRKSVNMICLYPPKPLQITAGKIKLFSVMMPCFPQADNSLEVVSGATCDRCACRDSCSSEGESVTQVIFCSYNSQVSPKRFTCRHISRGYSYPPLLLLKHTQLRQVCGQKWLWKAWNEVLDWNWGILLCDAGVGKVSRDSEKDERDVR